MYGAEHTWERRKKEIIAAIAAEVADTEAADRIFSVVDDVVDEVRYDARQEGAYEESYHHVCNPDW